MSGPLGSSQWMYSAGGDFTIPYSCRFNSDDSTYLHRTPASASNRTTFTISYWVKMCEVGDPPWGGSNIFSIDNLSLLEASIAIIKFLICIFPIRSVLKEQVLQLNTN